MQQQQTNVNMTAEGLQGMTEAKMYLDFDNANTDWNKYGYVTVPSKVQDPYSGRIVDLTVSKILLSNNHNKDKIYHVHKDLPKGYYFFPHEEVDTIVRDDLKLPVNGVYENANGDTKFWEIKTENFEPITKERGDVVQLGFMI